MRLMAGRRESENFFAQKRRAVSLSQIYKTRAKREEAEQPRWLATVGG